MRVRLPSSNVAGKIIEKGITLGQRGAELSLRFHRIYFSEMSVMILDPASAMESVKRPSNWIDMSIKTLEYTIDIYTLTETLNIFSPETPSSPLIIEFFPYEGCRSDRS